MMTTTIPVERLDQYNVELGYLKKPTIERSATFVPIVSKNIATEVPQDTTSSTSTTVTTNRESCYAIPVSTNSPTGIAGCEIWGVGVASHYGQGTGVAMNFCTWTYRNTLGCGYVTVKSFLSGLTVTVPVIDYCDCYTGTANERIIDLQRGVVELLGLNPSLGLYDVEVYPVQ